MGINMPSQMASPLDRLASALQIAHTIYSIPQAQAANEMAQSKLAQEKQTVALQQQMNDPNSDYSKARQAATTSALQTLVSKGQLKPDQASPLLASVGKQSGASLDKLSETSPLFAMANKDAQLQFMAQALQQRAQQGQERNQLTAGKDYTKIMAPYESTIQAANRADEIVNKIKSGELKSTPTLKTDLSAALGSMFNNGKAATVHSMSQGDVDSLYGRIQKNLGFVENAPVNTIPPQQLEQLQKDIQSLRGAYADAHEVAYDSFKEGLPPRLSQSFDKRFSTFREKALKGGNSSSPGTMMAGSNPAQSSGGLIQSAQAGSFAPHPQDSEAVQWAKQNPKDPRAVKILQMNGVSQ